jgi:hypothetical protein
MLRRLLLLLVFAFAAGAAPRPISDAERAAVDLVANYLARGPAALHAALTPDAPLRALPREQAFAELAARTGPAPGSTWKLQTADSKDEVAFHVTFPSGYDDALLFGMKEVDGAWRLHELRTIGEPSSMPTPTSRTIAVPLPVIASLGLVALVALLATLRRVRFASIALAAFAALFLVSLASRLIPQPRALPSVELRDAAPVREALARGETVRMSAKLSTDARSIALLWVLQSGREAMIAGTAADPFAGLGAISATPLGQLVRGRIAAGEDRRGDAATAFRTAASIAPLRDDLLSEAAMATTDDSYLDRLVKLGSRDAATYYAVARREAAAGRMQRAEDAFRTAWTLEPLPREELIRDKQLLPLLREETLLAAEEPLQAASSAGRSPLPLPPSAKPYVLGSLLRVSVGGATLDVPGGAELAPMTARVVPATHWQRERDAADLRDAEWLLAHRGAIRSSPPLRLLRATAALARHRRWADVVTIASGSSASPLLVARIDALFRLGRRDDAQALTRGAAVRRLAASKRDPLALVAIGDAAVRARDYQLAESFYAAARGTAWEEVAAARLKRIEALQELVSTGETRSTANFRIRHRGGDLARIAWTLEAELARLRQRLPQVAFEPVVVNVFDDDDFRAATGADHIRGQYDGEIILPVNADASTIAHELTHALLAQLTRDNAPRWFQEGLAERMEAVPPPEPQRLLPITLLDALMETAATPGAMRDGYQVAHAFVRFLEQRYGEGVIIAMIEEMASGLPGDLALMNATGKSIGRLDAEFRASMHELAPVADVVREDVLAQSIR